MLRAAAATGSSSSQADRQVLIIWRSGGLTLQLSAAGANLGVRPPSVGCLPSPRNYRLLESGSSPTMNDARQTAGVIYRVAALRNSPEPQEPPQPTGRFESVARG
jgi:hypothetical protein